VFFDQAMRFMDDARAENRLFFAYIATNVPHWDWSVPPAWIEPYAEVKPRERACFYASVERADWNLGRLMVWRACADGRAACTREAPACHASSAGQNRSSAHRATSAA
jgi:hypothetical protein